MSEPKSKTTERRWDHYLPMPWPICVFVIGAAYMWTHYWMVPLTIWIMEAVSGK